MWDFLQASGPMGLLVVFVEFFVLILFVNSILNTKIRLKALLIWNIFIVASGVLGTLVGQSIVLRILVETIKTNPHCVLQAAVPELLDGFQISLTTTILALMILLINIILFGIVNWIIEKRKIKQAM